MSIGAVTPNFVINNQRPERQDMEALQKALSSGDLAGAQQAFAQFKQDFHGAHNGHALFQTGVSDTLKQDLQGLQSALKSGDLAGAQQAFAQFKQDFQNLQQAKNQPPAFIANDGDADSGSKTAATGGVNVLA
jgi:hypothetical protein